MLGHHGAVQVEKEPVDVLQRREVLKDLADDALIGILGHVRRGRRLAPRQRQQLVPLRLRRLDEAGDRDVDALDGLDQRLAARQARPAAGPGEGGGGRLRRGAGGGLLLGAAESDAGTWWSTISA